MASDDLRNRIDAAIRPNLLIGLQDAELYDEPGKERINEWADWISQRVAELVQSELDRLRSACRSAAVLLRATADHRPDHTALQAAARDLDEVAGPEPTQPTEE